MSCHSDTITKCFRKAGFVTDSSTHTDSSGDLSSTTVAERTDIDNLFDRLRDIAPISMITDEYLSLDETPVPTELLSTQDIAQNILEERYSTDEKAEEETVNPVPKVTTKAAFQAVEKLRMFFTQQDDSSAALTTMNVEKSLVDNFASKAQKQTTIDSFFTARDNARISHK